MAASLPVHWHLCLILLIYISIITKESACADDANDHFSGFYKPNLRESYEIYAGSYFTTKEELFDSYKRIPRVKNLEGVTTSLVESHKAIMTRDYFDYSVVHLSPTVSQLLTASIKNSYSSIQRRTALSNDALRSSVGTVPTDPRMMDETVAIMPFSTIPASMFNGDNDYQNAIRANLFSSTYWSIRRYIKHVIIFTGRKKDREYLDKMGIDPWKVVDLSHHYNDHVRVDGDPGSRKLLPRDTIIHVYNNMLNGEGQWGKFKYIYYSEGDLLLMLRHPNKLMDAMDTFNDKHIVLAPHRLQTQALPQGYPNLLSMRTKAAWARGTMVNLLNLQHVNLITENASLPVGSCCDNGRFKFPECGTWWYNCKEWGLRNYTTWLRFGKFGFTMPAGTEHRARCSYSTEKRLCEIPEGCATRAARNLDEVCKELPNIEMHGSIK
jgi:hypothetical protein